MLDGEVQGAGMQEGVRVEQDHVAPLRTFDGEIVGGCEPEVYAAGQETDGERSIGEPGGDHLRRAVCGGVVDHDDFSGVGVGEPFALGEDGLDAFAQQIARIERDDDDGDRESIFGEQAQSMGVSGLGETAAQPGWTQQGADRESRLRRLCSKGKNSSTCVQYRARGNLKSAWQWFRCRDGHGSFGGESRRPPASEQRRLCLFQGRNIVLRKRSSRRAAAKGMRSREKKRRTARTALARGGVAAALVMLSSLAGAPNSRWSVKAGIGTSVTHLRVTNQVIMPGVTRLGINLGEQNYYDSGQMMRNLLYRNPGFEGMAYRSILHCLAAGPAMCTDTRRSFQWPAGFWDGGRFEVLDGTAAGRRGGVKGSGPGNQFGQAGGYGVRLEAGGTAIGTGDWLAVSKDFPGDPTAGWWPSTKGGAKFEAERRDLSPETAGHQALRIEAANPGQSAELKSYFDTLEGMTFVRLRGRFRLSFRAKGVAGTKVLHVHVKRIVAGRMDYLEQDFLLTTGWADYHAEFTANEGAGPVGPVEAGFSANGSSLLLDDVDLERTDGDRTNRTAFRDEVVQTLRELRPGVLRLMSSHAELGSTVDNLLAPPMARQRPGYSTWLTTMEDIPVGIPEFLDLCSEIGAEPWIVAPTAMSKDEARKLGEYLTGGAATAGGAMRVAAGRREPWTRTFRTIHIELGNETWNGIFQGETMEDPAAYGRRANLIFSALRAAAGSDWRQLDLVVGGQAANPGRSGEVMKAATEANTLAIAPYLMDSVNHWANVDELYGPLMAEPEQMSRGGIVDAARGAAGGRQLAVYEVNLHTTEGAITQEALDRLTPSTAAGIAVAGHMLRMMRDEGVRDDMVFSLPQFRFKRADGKLVRLWGTVLEMGPNGRMRPQFLTESLANRVIRGNLVRVEVSGDIPTHDQPEGNDGVQLRGMHEIDAYAFQEGKWHGLIVFNYGLHQSRRLSLEGPGLRSNPNVNLWTLVSTGPGASNESETEVTVNAEQFGGTQLDVAPCSMAVLEWTE